VSLTEVFGPPDRNGLKDIVPMHADRKDGTLLVHSTNGNFWCASLYIERDMSTSK
jgi:hypothetical protein